MRARVSPPFICLSENPNVSPFHRQALSPLACWNLHHRAFAWYILRTSARDLRCRTSARSLRLGASAETFVRGSLHGTFIAGPLDGTFVAGPLHKTFGGGPPRGTFTKGPSLVSLLQGAFFSWPYLGPLFQQMTWLYVKFMGFIVY